MSHLQVTIASIALKKMLCGASLSICTITDIGEMLGVDPRGTQAYKMLKPLHCVEYSDVRLIRG